MRTFFTTLLLFVSLTGTALCAPVAPPIIGDGITAPATLGNDPVQRISLGHFVAKFEETTLGEILAAVGHGSIEHAGDAGASQYWLCYSLPNQRLWLISNGEMGGSDHTLSAVSAQSINSGNVENLMCPTLPAAFQPVSFGFGWLGTDREKVIQALGEPSATKDNRIMFFYEGKQPGSYHGQTVDWDVLGYVEMKLEEGKVTFINASHVTSY